MPKYTARRSRRNIKRRATKKRGGMDPPPHRASSNPPPHDNRRQPVILSSTSSYHSAPPTYNETYLHLLAESPEMGKQSNRASSSNMGTRSNRVSRSNMETQTNNNTRNITNMTEDQLLQQYSSVYETISSKADAVESTALFKKHIQTIQNPIAMYIVANMDSSIDGYEIHKNASLTAYIITRIDVHIVLSTFKGWPLRAAYPSYHANMQQERMKALGFLMYRENINTLLCHLYHQFKNPLDARLIRMFQSISKIPNIGKTDTFASGIYGCQRPHTIGCHVKDDIGGLIRAL